MSIDTEHTCSSRLLDLRVAGERGSVVGRTIRRAIDRGELTGYRVGGVVRVDEAELMEWLKSRPIPREAS